VGDYVQGRFLSGGLPFLVRASRFLSAHRARSMVAELAAISSFLTSPLMPKGSSRNLMFSRISGTSIFPHRYQKNAHMGP